MSEIIKLNTIEGSAFGVITALLSADKAEGSLRKYRESAAEMIYDLAIDVWAVVPEMTAVEVKELFEADYKTAMSKHVALGNVDVDYVTKNKKIDQAFRKILNALSKGLDIRALGSTHACEKAVKLDNEKLQADKIKEATNKAISDKAKREGTTVEEARAALAKLGVVEEESGKSKVLPDSGGEVPNQDYIVLQDNLDRDAVRNLLNDLSTVMEHNPDQATNMLASWNNKAQASANAVLKNLVKSSSAA